jgi:hypothetical protein
MELVYNSHQNSMIHTPFTAINRVDLLYNYSTITLESFTSKPHPEIKSNKEWRRFFSQNHENNISTVKQYLLQ